MTTIDVRALLDAAQQKLQEAHAEGEKLKVGLVRGGSAGCVTDGDVYGKDGRVHHAEQSQQGTVQISHRNHHLGASAKRQADHSTGLIRRSHRVGDDLVDVIHRQAVLPGGHLNQIAFRSRGRAGNGRHQETSVHCAACCSRRRRQLEDLRKGNASHDHDSGRSRVG